MKKAVHVNTWEECEQRLLQIKNETPGEVWFRGHSNACWCLTTTLERQIIRPDFAYFIADYWALMLKIKPHSRQHSCYTVCAEREEKTQHWRFVSHQRIFDAPGTGQDVLYKTIVPASERMEILKRLDSDNYNAFSLFGSEDALMDTLAFREVDLKPD